MPEKFLKLPQGMEITTLGTSTIYRLMDKGDFPRPVRLTEKAVAWKLSDVEQWMNERKVA